MVDKNYLPDRGDIVWLDPTPTRGREQSKVRPALVVSPKAYNRKADLALFCPITSVMKGYPFEVVIKTAKIQGVVLSDQVRSMDWKARKVVFIAKAPTKVLQETVTKITLLVQG